LLSDKLEGRPTKDSKSNLFATVAFAFTVARLHARLQSRSYLARSLALARCAMSRSKQSLHPATLLMSRRRNVNPRQSDSSGHSVDVRKESKFAHRLADGCWTSDPFSSNEFAGSLHAIVDEKQSFF